MSRITNDNISKDYGTATHTEMNTKFTDVATASAAIGGVNVRSEGIDRRNLAATAIIKSIETAANGSTSATTYAAKTGQAAFAINHDNDVEISFGAGGITLEDGDLLRLHFTAYVESSDQDVTTSTASWCLIVFPAWDITDNTLTNYEMFPDKVDLFDPGSSPPEPYPIGPGFAGDNDSSGLAIYPITGWNNGGTYEWHRCNHGSLLYEHSGNDLTVYGIRLYGRGPMLYEHHGTPSADGRAFVYDTSLGVGIDFDIERAHMTSIIMKKGSMS